VSRSSIIFGLVSILGKTHIVNGSNTDSKAYVGLYCDSPAYFFNNSLDHYWHKEYLK